ncbi:MAG: tetratricopeptide repeat protein [Bacteroidota bacterium]
MKTLHIIILSILCSFSVKISAQNESFSINDLMQKGQYAQALSLLEKLNIGDSTQVEVLQKQAFCNFKLGRLLQAKKMYYSALEKNVDSPEILLQIATIAEKDYNLLEALKTFQRLNKFDSTNTFYLKELARINTRMERAKLGISYLKKAIEIDDKDIESIVSLANLYLNDSKDDLAEPLITKGFELDSSSIKMRHLRSRLLYRKSDFKGVRSDLLFTMTLGDSTSFYQRLLGTSFYQMDSISQSIAVFKRLLKNGENTENVRAGLAFAQLKSTENNVDVLRESTDNFYLAIDLGKSDRLTDYELGLADVSDKLGQIETAIHRFENLVNSRPKATFRLAEIYEKKKKDKAMALIYYEEYIRACGAMKKPTADCNFVEFANLRINNLKTNKPTEMPKVVVAKDSVEIVVDTVRNDD